jgi:hypothetical protein
MYKRKETQTKNKQNQTKLDSHDLNLPCACSLFLKQQRRAPS